MNQETITTTSALIKQISIYCENEIGLDKNYDTLCSQYFEGNEGELKSFKNNLAIAINSNFENIIKSFNNNIKKMKFIKSIIKIIQYGTDINYKHIYWEFKQDILELQYQAKIKILEKNQFLIQRIDYILDGEVEKITKDIDGNIKLEHNIDLKKRANLPSVKTSKDEFFKECIGGYVQYIKDNKNYIFLLEKDSFISAYDLSNQKIKYTNHNGLNITLIHRLFDYLILKDWSDNDYKENHNNQTIDTTNIEYSYYEILKSEIMDCDNEKLNNIIINNAKLNDNEKIEIQNIIKNKKEFLNNGGLFKKNC